MVTIEHYARVVASVYDAAVSRDWAPALTAIHRMFDADGVTTRAGRLTIVMAAAERRLREAVLAVCATAPEDVGGGQSFSCARLSGRRRYVVQVLPLHRDDRTRSSGPALVIITDPERIAEPDHALVQDLFGLTKMEAQIAVRLARGLDVRQLAEGLSISTATVRTHLQHVFDKTDTHRQAELVRLLATLSR